MEYLISNRPIIEIFYLLSGPLALIGIGVGLFQVYILKRELHLKYRRESIKETLMAFERIAPLIDQKYLDLANAHVERSIPVYDKELDTFDYDGFPDNCAWLAQVENDNFFADISIALLNHIESLAQIVLSGLVDEDFAYETNGFYFINLVEDLRVYIAANRDGKNRFAYSSTIRLYDRWSVRNKNEGLLQQHIKLTAELGKIPKTKIIKPIGLN